MFRLHSDQSDSDTLDLDQNPEMITERIQSKVTKEHDQDLMKFQDILGDVIDAITQDTSGLMLETQL
ncbi:hypothetical protein RSAG8_11968, partial [Rhizoctonia solani AG-8 WAC10335]